jgi:cell division ATPase FtsA
VRVVELGDSARLAPEPLELVGVRAHLAVHQLDRDLALQHRVERAVDRGHAAVPDLCVEPVAAGEERAHL